VPGPQLEVLSAELTDLVLPNASLERIHGGCLWTEGPVYFPVGDHVLWSDIPANRVYQWVPELGARILLHHANNANGHTRDREGRLVTCEHLTRVRRALAPRVTTASNRR